jgi:catechol 2,3-dioxygenase-like lactoylglutathione lyase family enzyme
MLRATMSAVSRINHVSVNAKDLATSVAFYVDVLGAEPLATPDFGLPVQWLGIGASQLHLFEAGVDPLSHHHFAVTVEDLEPVYRRAEARGAFDHEAFGNHLVELPGDMAQTYLRDPAGNLVELDTPGASRLPDALRSQLKRLEDMRPQTAENRSARLYAGG